MYQDASKEKSPLAAETDVCIVGSGPAGITLAREFLRQGRDVTVLESGGRKIDANVQELNAGEVVGDSYKGLRDTRHRQVGGVPNIWNTPVRAGLGAKYVPLDSWDFQKRDDVPHSGWPFGLSELEPFYRRAHEVCGLGPFSYEGKDWVEALGPTLVPELTKKVYQFGSRTPFIKTCLDEITGHPNGRLIHGATVHRISMKGGRAVEAEGSTWSGHSLRVTAKSFILATGGMENARLLLLSGEGEGACPGNDHGWVGRCFMEHPRDHGLSLEPYSQRLFSEATFYDTLEAEDGTMVGGRLGLSEEAVLGRGLPNASVTLLPRVRERSALINWAVRFWLCPHSAGFRRFKGGYGWSRMKDPGRWLEGFRMVVNTEQRPNPENRIVLSNQKDRFGIPRAELHWRWRSEEQSRLEQLRESLALWIEHSGFGRVTIQKDLLPDPNACHHAGTTRMHADPKQGVVDPDGRVHGTENLFVAGGSVFPTSGYANPTLTIVALALRLADHLGSNS